MDISIVSGRNWLTNSYFCKYTYFILLSKTNYINCLNCLSSPGRKPATSPPGGLSELPPCAKPGLFAPGWRLPTPRRDSQRRHSPVIPRRWPPARLSSSATGLSAPPQSRHPTEMAASTPFLLCDGTLSTATVPSSHGDGRQHAFPPPRRDSQRRHSPVTARSTGAQRARSNY